MRVHDEDSKLVCDCEDAEGVPCTFRCADSSSMLRHKTNRHGYQSPRARLAGQVQHAAYNAASPILFAAPAAPDAAVDPVALAGYLAAAAAPNGYLEGNFDFGCIDPRFGMFDAPWEELVTVTEAYRLDEAVRLAQGVWTG